RPLSIIRHAKALLPKPGMDDRTRALIERGRRDAARIGAYMAAEALVPDTVLISPSVRTQETWKFAAPAFRSSIEVVTEERLYDATVETIADLLRNTPVGVQSLLVVGHNPGLHDLALALNTSGNAEARKQLKRKLPTAGLVIIDFAFDDWSKLSDRSGRLDRFVSPRLVRRR